MRLLIQGLLETLACLVAPSRCAACDGDVPPATAFCPTCARTLVRATNPDAGRIAAFEYGGALAQALRRFKFDDRPDLARALLAGLALEMPRLALPRVDIVVPVPLHPSRLVERGYNQAALLAGPLARSLGVPASMQALARAVATDRQTELSRPDRAANVRGAFVASDHAAVRGRAILLVDDVETTGATLAACRSALMSAGAGSARSVVIARAQPHASGRHVGGG